MINKREFYPTVSEETWEKSSSLFSEKEWGIICDSLFIAKNMLEENDDLHNDFAHIIYKISAI